jgi:hypothetical protein
VGYAGGEIAGAARAPNDGNFVEKNRFWRIWHFALRHKLVKISTSIEGKCYILVIARKLNSSCMIGT